MSFLKSLLSFCSPLDDEPYESQYTAVGEFLDLADPAGEHEGCDSVNGSCGQFGIEPTNPIPVNGFPGELFYLSRLRSKAGFPFLFHRLGSNKSPVEASHIIDIYEVVDIKASSWNVLFFCPYHVRRSQAVPRGMKRTSWRKLSPLQRIFSKTAVFGVNSSVADFPTGLPAAIYQLVVASIPPEFNPTRMATTVADTVRKQLEERPHAWERPASHIAHLEDLAKRLGKMDK